MPRRRWIIALSLFAVLLVGVELALRRLQSPKACVQVINDGDGTMEDVIIEYNGTTVPVGRLPMGTSTHIWLTAGPKGLLRIDFRQKGNALKGFQVSDFDPMQNLQDAFKLVLVVKTNEIQKYVEDDEFRKDKETLGDRIKQWMRSEIEPPK
jgi:hypothetical protein